MPLQEVLILAMTQMRSGICVAGMTCKTDPVTCLQWVRPIRDFDTVQLGDMTNDDGQVACCCDVIEMNLVEPRPDPPHVEDWLTDFVHHRPQLMRRLADEKRANFFPRHLDRAPEDVFHHHTRSLCLIQPEQIWARFSLDGYSGKFEARMGFVLAADANHPQATSRRGITVTDLKWQALGRSWFGKEGGRLALDQDALWEWLGADTIYLTVGLSRNWQGEYWPLVVGVHVVPDYRTA